VLCQNIWSDYIWERAKWKVHSVMNYHNIDETLPSARKHGPSKLEVKVLNYFQLQKTNDYSYNSITTEFYCDALGMEVTPNTCAFTRRRGWDEKQANEGSITNVVYSHIIQTAREVGFITPSNTELEATGNATSDCEKNPDPKIISSELQNQCIKNRNRIIEKRNQITNNGTVTIHGTNISKITTWQELATSHRERLGSNNSKAWNQVLPLSCPPKNELEVLLNKSLAFEELVLPDFYNTPLGKEEHIRLFWDTWLGEKNIFCWVNSDQLFRNATTWDEILNERMLTYKWYK